MKRIIAIVCLSLGCASVVLAATPQQERMKMCNADAKGKTGDERKAFMKECLSADQPGASAPSRSIAAEPKGTMQQQKMASCNAEAGSKTGDERKAFMKDCLAAKPAAVASPKGTEQQNRMKTCNADAKGKTGDERKAFMKECLSKS